MIHVGVKYTEKATKSPELLQRLAQPMLLARALARRIHERVAEQGDLATIVQTYKDELQLERRSIRAKKESERYSRQLIDATAKGYARRVAELTNKLRKADDTLQNTGDALDNGYRVSDAYAKLLGLTQSKFRSSAAFHMAAGTKVGTFRVSGGMWSGLGVRNVGANAAILDFFGSTLGGSTQSGKTKGGRERSRPVNVRNQIKAGTVFRQSGVNVIQPKEAEEAAMVAAVCKWAQTMVAKTLGATMGQFKGDGDQQLLMDILQLYDGSR